MTIKERRRNLYSILEESAEFNDPKEVWRVIDFILPQEVLEKEKTVASYRGFILKLHRENHDTRSEDVFNYALQELSQALRLIYDKQC